MNRTWSSPLCLIWQQRAASLNTDKLRKNRASLKIRNIRLQLRLSLVCSCLSARRLLTLIYRFLSSEEGKWIEPLRPPSVAGWRLKQTRWLIKWSHLAVIQSERPTNTRRLDENTLISEFQLEELCDLWQTEVDISLIIVSLLHLFDGLNGKPAYYTVYTGVKLIFKHLEWMKIVQGAKQTIKMTLVASQIQINVEHLPWWSVCLCHMLMFSRCNDYDVYFLSLAR